MCCILGWKTLLSQCLSLPRSINGTCQTVREAWWIAKGVGVTLWTDIPSRGGWWYSWSLHAKETKMGSSWLPTLLTCRLYHILFLIYVHALRKISETVPHVAMEHVYTNFYQLGSTCKRLPGTYYTDRALILSFSAMKSSLLLEITESTINMLMLLSYFCVENWTKSLG